MRRRRDRIATATASLAAAALLSTGPTPAADQVVNGPEFQVSEWTTGYQGFPRVAVHDSGSFVVVWDDYGRDGDLYGVFARRFSSSGQPLASSFLVNTTTIEYQKLPAIAMDSTGAFVVVWDHYTDIASGYDIRGQRFDSAGMKVGAEFAVNTYTTDWQRLPDVAMDDAGDFVVVWESRDQDGDYYGIFGQRFDSTATPIGAEFQVSAYTTGYQDYPRVAMNGAGEFIVAWASESQDGNLGGVFAQRYDSAGGPLGGEFQVNSYTTFNQLYPVAAIGATGDFVVSWDGATQDGDGGGIFMRRFDSTGAALTGDLQVNSFTTDYQTFPAITNDDAGNFAVVWNSFDQVSASSSYDVFGQVFDSGGTPLGGEFRVNTETFSDQRLPAVGMSGSGRFVVVWDSFYQDGDFSGIFGQRFCSPDDPVGCFAVTSPLDGGNVDCSDPRNIRPTITWDPARFDRFRVWVGSDPAFPKGTRVKSWKGFKPVFSWTPGVKKWKAACNKALTGNPMNPVLFIRVQGRDDALPKSDPDKFDYTLNVMVDANF